MSTKSNLRLFNEHFGTRISGKTIIWVLRSCRAAAQNTANFAGQMGLVKTGWFFAAFASNEAAAFTSPELLEPMRERFVDAIEGGLDALRRMSLSGEDENLKRARLNLQDALSTLDAPFDD